MADPHKKRKRVLRYAGRRSCDDGGRHWSDAFKSQGMLSAADNIIRCQKGAKKNLSRISSRLTTLLAPSFWTSGLQDCKQKKKKNSVVSSCSGGNHSFWYPSENNGASTMAWEVKNPLQCRDTEDTDLISGLGRGNGNLLQYSCLKNPTDRGACGLQKSWTQLKD